MWGKLREFALRHLVADTPPLAPRERWKTALGSLLGLSLAGGLIGLFPNEQFWVLASLGATSIILFALPQSPLAQPWSVFGGYLAATLAALLGSALFPSPIVAGAVAVAITVWCMTRFKCMHPPGGALALILVGHGAPSLAQAGHTMVLVLGNAIAIILAALAVNNLLLGRRYPQCRIEEAPGLHLTRDPSPTHRTGLSHGDLAYAVQSQQTFVDVQEKDLVRIFNTAVDHAFERHMGTSCGDIMARDVVTVEYGTDLEEAWRLLRYHKVKALPVVDSFQRIQGIVTVADFLRQLDDTSAAGLAVRLQGFLRRTPGESSEKAEVVGQIMTTTVFTATVHTPVAELVHNLSDAGLHHIPIVDERKKLVGMVTQSDLIAALYRRVALAAA